MIGEFEMRSGQINLRHVTRSAVLRFDFAARRRAFLVRLRRRRRLARSASWLVTGQAFRVVISLVMRRRLMRVVTCHAAYPVIIRVTFAAEDAIRLKADTVHADPLWRHDYLFGAAMTGAAEVLAQLIAAEPSRIEDLVLIRLAGFACRHVLGAGAVTRLASDSRRQLLEMQLIAADRAGRVAIEALHDFVPGESIANRFNHRLRARILMAKCQVQALDLGVKAHAALVIITGVFEHVSLSGLPLPEAVKDRF